MRDPCGAAIPIRVEWKLLRRILGTHARLTEARVRRVLPSRWGGRFRERDLRLRLLGIDDVPALASLYMTDDTGQRALSDRLRRKSTQRCTGAFINGELIGCCWRSQIETNSGLWWITGLHTKRELRRRGVAQWCIRHALHEAKSSGISTVYTWVKQSNFAASAAALRCGGFLYNPTDQMRKVISEHTRRQAEDYQVYEYYTETLYHELR